MYEVKVSLTGIAPMAQHRLTEEDIALIEKSSTGGHKDMTKPAREEEAMRRMYVDQDGFICVPRRNIKSCLLEGVKKAGLKFGRGSLAPYVKATVYVKEDMPSLGIKKPDLVERFAVQRKDGNQVVVVRGVIKEGWKLNFTLLVVDDRRDPDQLRTAMEEGGVLVGLCAGRPDYGRFEVTKWEVVKAKK